MEPGLTHILLDFFGTIVEYVPGGAANVSRSCAVVRSLGVDISEAEFVTYWESTFAQFELRSSADHSEFSMTELAAAFLTTILGSTPARSDCDRLVETYLDEWNTGVAYPPDVVRVIDDLAGRFRLAVVTNTHDPELVPQHLNAIGVADRIDVVVTSVEVGWRKPHPAIYQRALHQLAIQPAQAVFVGDTFEADYAGPRAAGITAFLIDPTARYNVPARQRLDRLADLSGRL